MLGDVVVPSERPALGVDMASFTIRRLLASIPVLLAVVDAGLRNGRELRGIR